MDNPLLEELHEAGVLPDISIELPTGGVFYDEGVFEEGTDIKDIPIGTLGILDENAFRDPVLLATGKAIKRLIQHVCPCILRPGELAEVDVEAILIATRLASYGPNLNLTHTCQNPEIKSDAENPEEAFVCREKNELVIDLQEFIMRYGALENMEEFDLTLSIGQHVRLRPTTYDMAIQLMMDLYKTSRKVQSLSQLEIEDTLFDENLMQSYIDVIDSTVNTNIDALLSSIYSVTSKSGVVYQERDMIEAWLLQLPKPVVDEIRNRITKISTRLKKIPEVKYNCQHCGFENTLYVQLDPQMLFSQAEGSGTPTKPSAPSKRTGKKGKTQSRVSRK